MKAIINGLLYDTVASTVLYSDGMVCLMKTQKGSYFKTDLDGIIPMSIDETKEFLGIKDVNVYISEFGEVSPA